MDIQVADDAVEIKATMGWKYDDKTKKYICKERACELFYRMVELPEEFQGRCGTSKHERRGNRVVLPKKTPKQKKKVLIE